jgi:hypothetical protein
MTPDQYAANQPCRACGRSAHAGIGRWPCVIMALLINGGIATLTTILHV